MYNQEQGHDVDSSFVVVTKPVPALRIPDSYISKIKIFCSPGTWVDSVYRRPEIQAKLILPPSQQTNRQIKQDVAVRRSSQIKICFLPTSTQR